MATGLHGNGASGPPNDHGAAPRGTVAREGRSTRVPGVGIGRFRQRGRSRDDAAALAKGPRALWWLAGGGADWRRRRRDG